MTKLQADYLGWVFEGGRLENFLDHRTLQELDDSSYEIWQLLQNPFPEWNSEFLGKLSRIKHEIEVLADERVQIYLELEKKHEAEMVKLNRMSEAEWLDIFPEAKKLIPDIIKELEAKRGKIRGAIKNKLQYVKHNVTDDVTQYFLRTWVKSAEGQKLLKVNKNIERLKPTKSPRKLKILQLKKKTSEDKKQQALSVSFEDVASQYIQLRKSGKNFTGLCYFHSEKHPSFFIFPDNKAKCFSCGWYGDVIRFVQDTKGVKFPEAIEWLIGV